MTKRCAWGVCYSQCNKFNGASGLGGWRTRPGVGRVFTYREQMQDN